MVDLNLWRLEYPGTLLELGTHESGYPLTKQVSPGVVATEYGDRPHPVTNGMVTGTDRSRGRVWTFTGAHLLAGAVTGPGEDEWTRNLDLSETLEAAWAAEAITDVDGAVATLTNVDRGRTLFGRPRNYIPTLDRVRRGWSDWTAEFHTVDRRAYGEERAVNVSTVAGQVGGFTMPLTMPATSSEVSGTRARVFSAGSVYSWPVLAFAPGCVNPGIELLDADGSKLWALWIDGVVPEAQPVVIDTRPWSRGTTIGGAYADGRLRGTRLEDCRIPVGQSEVRYKATTAPGGTIAATVNWRDAYMGL